MMAAISAAYSGVPAVILERNEQFGKKLRITGKGRCNITNHCDNNQLIANTPVNGRFLYSAFSAFNADDMISFLENAGLPVKTERGNRVFPVSDSAADVVNTLVEQCKMLGCKFINGRAAKLLKENGRIVGVMTYDGVKIDADAVIICTGGLSYPTTGSSGDGYTLASSVGHSIVKPKPSLVPLSSPDSFCSDLMGLSLRNISVKVEDKSSKSIIYTDFGEMLFTHFGLSGPVILSASSHMKDPKSGNYCIHIDLKPALTEEQLDKRLLHDFAENTNRDFSNSLSALLPRKLIPIFIERSGIAPNTKMHQITREQRHRMLSLLKDFSVNVDGFRPISEAIITSGGVNVNEIVPKTMKSKLIDGLYFAGEVIDVDAYTGGFNLQIAWSTGWIAGHSAASEILFGNDN